MTHSTQIRAATTRAIHGAVVVALMSLAGCANMTSRDQNMVGGAAVGAVAGAVLTGGSPIGTVGGAAVGGVIGNAVTPTRR
ncbi:MAG TPA: glycine zipper 2TM domain-containing protein [Ramlibacter sp.]|nr:glycine zipper 2TM domain-containing protein [Ramlibacter sp.]